MTIEEKAKRYDEVFEIAKKIHNEHRAQCADVMTKIFPELAESEDERIRKSLIGHLKECRNNTRSEVMLGEYAKWIAWLEKQAEHKKFRDSIQVGDKVTRNKDGVLVNLSQLKRVAKKDEKQGKQSKNEDKGILHRFSFYSYKDEPNILYLAGLYVDDEYRNKGIGTKILKVANEVAASMKCNSIRLKTEKGSHAEKLYRENGYTTILEEENQIWLEKQGEQKPVNLVTILNDYFANTPKEQQDKDWEELKHFNNFGLELIEQKADWSEEDETCMTNIIIMLKEGASHHFIKDDITKAVDWLKSIRPQKQWKPSDLPHWKKSTLPNDNNTTGFNSDYFCHKGYIINYKELFEKLPKDD